VGECGIARVGFEGHDPAIGGHGLGHAQRGVAGERTDLQDALRAQHRDQHREQSALDRACHHYRRLRRRRGEGGHLGEQR
jgi:hypothetical protein